MSQETERRQNINLNQVVDLIYMRFKQIESCFSPEGQKSYTLQNVVKDAVETLRLNNFDLLKQLVDQTSVSPDEVELNDVFASRITDWQDLKTMVGIVAENILGIEVKLRHPDVLQESERRGRQFG